MAATITSTDFQLFYQKVQERNEVSTAIWCGFVDVHMILNMYCAGMTWYMVGEACTEILIART